MEHKHLIQSCAGKNCLPHCPCDCHIQQQTEAEKKIEELYQNLSTRDFEENIKSMLLEAMKWAVERVMPEEIETIGMKYRRQNPFDFVNWIYDSEEEKRQDLIYIGRNECRDHIISTSKEIFGHAKKISF